jgi:hypothetical protein
MTERGECWPVEVFLVAILDLLDSKLVVIWCDGDITAVDDLEAGQERVHFEWNVAKSADVILRECRLGQSVHQDDMKCQCPTTSMLLDQFHTYTLHVGDCIQRERR